MVTKITSKDQLKSLLPETKIFKYPIDAGPESVWNSEDETKITYLVIATNNVEMEELKYIPATFESTNLNATESVGTIQYATDHYDSIIESSKYWI